MLKILKFLLRLLGIHGSLVFIGMSNLGKSHWAEKLETLGYVRVWADNEIKKNLGPSLPMEGHNTVEEAMAEWMEQPFGDNYPKNSAIYLKHEKQVMWSAIWRMLKGEQLVVDTTGSVIYCGWLILFLLRLLGTVVLLDAPEGHEEVLYQEYLVGKKPRIWGDGTYAPMPGEDPWVALARCFPNLLKTRNFRYRPLAHVVLDYFELRAPGFGLNELLEKVGR